MKQSNNVLVGLVTAAQSTEGLVYLIEDDVFIGKDFFTMSKAIHAESDAFCVIMTANHNSNYHVSDNTNAYYLSDNGDYQSLGVSFKAKNITNFIYPHFTRGLLLNPRQYCIDHFPVSKIGLGFTEQDGIIRRIIEKNNFKVAFPHVPRAFHAGWYGKNRKKNKQGYNRNIDYKVARVYQDCFDPERMKELNGELWRDSIPVALDTTHDRIELINVSRHER
jgi:hypothetical protein